MKVGDDRMVESGIALVEHIERMQRYLGGGLRARQLRIRLARRWPKAARAADKRKLTAFCDKCIRLIARYEEMRERESE